MPTLKKRNEQVFSMREQGASFGKIAARFKISRNRVSQIVMSLRYERVRSDKWLFWSMLSNRTRNALNKAFGEEAFSHPQVVLQHGRKGIAMLRGMGVISLREIDNAFVKLGMISKKQKW